MLEFVWLMLTTVAALIRPREDLVLENLLLRHQLALLARPTRTRPRTRLRTRNRLLWVLARRICTGWREHLTFVTPDTVVRWHRQGWRLFWRWKSRSRGSHSQSENFGRRAFLAIGSGAAQWLMAAAAVGAPRIRTKMIAAVVLAKIYGPGPHSMTLRPFKRC